ncbi:MAG: hypothetical protein KIS85_01645 [Anaerolineales bacterium]|nr:hypothetical protein [Anaerolineales bacterium]
MKKLTVFSAPKPFSDVHIGTIQRNAIRSWLQMGSEVEVLLIGDEPGLAGAAHELGVTHIRAVSRNQHGTPLVSAIFQAAREAAQGELLLFSNTDIIFFPETLPLALKVREQFAEFVLMGQRYDLELRSELDFVSGWPARLRAEVATRGRLHPEGGSDYFLFPRHLYSEIPDFAIGRAGWDNWMIYHAVQQPWMDINASADLTVVHQNHDYAHLSKGEGHQRHPETFENADLAGGWRKMYTLMELRHRLVGGRVQQAPWSLVRFLRGLERWLQPDELEGSGLRWRLLILLRQLRRRLTHTGAG